MLHLHRSAWLSIGTLPAYPLSLSSTRCAPMFFLFFSFANQSGSALPLPAHLISLSGEEGLSHSSSGTRQLPCPCPYPERSPPICSSPPEWRSQAISECRPSPPEFEALSTQCPVALESARLKEAASGTLPIHTFRAGSSQSLGHPLNAELPTTLKGLLPLPLPLPLKPNLKRQES